AALGVGELVHGGPVLARRGNVLCGGCHAGRVVALAGHGCLLRCFGRWCPNDLVARRLARISDTIKTSVRWRVDSVGADVYNSYMGSVRTAVLGGAASRRRPTSRGLDVDEGTEAEMTTVTIARAAADRQSRARDEGAVAEPLLHDAKPWVQGVRPAVRRVRPTGGMAPTVVRPGRGGGVGGPPRPIPCDRSYEANFHGSRLTRRGKVVVAAIWLVFAV